ncbi:MAG: hypothetical protein QXG39_06355 [Candidatus Aenigmatarchaeota archaeon]
MIDDKILISIYAFLITFLIKSIFEVIQFFFNNKKNHDNKDIAVLRTEIEYIKKEISEIKNELKRIR